MLRERRKTGMDLKGRDFLKLLDFTQEEIAYLVDLAAELKDKKKRGIPVDTLRGKNVALIFEKTSTRTRCAFEVAAHDLGMFEGIEYRGFGQDIVEELAEYAAVPVWNGLTNEFHPTQMLADLLTIREHFGHLEGIRLTYMGDARYNMGNSLMVACSKMGMDFVACAPEKYFPDPALVARSEGKRRARWPGYCLAACLTLVVAVSSVLLWRTEPALSPPDEQQPPATVKPDPPEEKQDPGGARPPLLQPPGSELGTLRMVSYTVSSQEKTVDFLIYVNEEQYAIREEKGLYSIRSTNPLPEDFPECGLDIFHLSAVSPEEARNTAAEALADHYKTVSLDDESAVLPKNPYLRASAGVDWNSEQAELWFVDDGQGGTFVLTARYFLEAEEGMGMQFRDMVSSFRVVPLDRIAHEWMRSLY